LLRGIACFSFALFCFALGFGCIFWVGGLLCFRGATTATAQGCLLAFLAVSHSLLLCFGFSATIDMMFMMVMVYVVYMDGWVGGWNGAKDADGDRVVCIELHVPGIRAPLSMSVLRVGRGDSEFETNC
jgi:hypothetical protein